MGPCLLNGNVWEDMFRSFTSNFNPLNRSRCPTRKHWAPLLFISRTAKAQRKLISVFAIQFFNTLVCLRDLAQIQCSPKGSAHVARFITRHGRRVSSNFISDVYSLTVYLHFKRHSLRFWSLRCLVYR